jgi:FAD/FMN-containing dehydrogenase
VIDLSRLANAEIIDPERHLVRIGSGATWGQVAADLARHGLAISSGDTKGVLRLTPALPPAQLLQCLIG